MKRVKIMVELDLGMFHDEDDLSEKHLLELLTVWDRSLIEKETPLQIMIEDTDTNLISNLIPCGETDT
jgi:hypothetical protein